MTDGEFRYYLQGLRLALGTALGVEGGGALAGEGRRYVEGHREMVVHVLDLLKMRDEVNAKTFTGLPADED